MASLSRQHLYNVHINNLKDTGGLFSAKISGKLLQTGVFQDKPVRFQISHLSNLALSSENVHFQEKTFSIKRGV